MIQDAFAKASSKQEGKLVTAKPEVAQLFRAIPPKPRLFAIRKKLAGRGYSIFSPTAVDSIRDYFYKRRRRITFMMPPPAHLISHEGGIKTEKIIDGETWVVHEFKSSQSFKVASTLKCEVLMIAGGGAGATTSNHFAFGGGGGGAGEAYYNPAITLTSGIYNVVVGAGGSLISQTNANRYANNGSDSYMIRTDKSWKAATKIIQAKGGGGGGAGSFKGASGGSTGGGYSGSNPRDFYNPAGFGNNGSAHNGDSKFGGGGGGAGGAASGSSGGAAKSMTIAGNTYLLGKGGDGGLDTNKSNGSHGAVNTGSGGGGAGGFQVGQAAVQIGTKIGDNVSLTYRCSYGSLPGVADKWNSSRISWANAVADAVKSKAPDNKWGTARAKNYQRAYGNWYLWKYVYKYSSFSQLSSRQNNWYEHDKTPIPVYSTAIPDTHFSGGNGGSGIVVIAYKKP